MEHLYEKKDEAKFNAPELLVRSQDTGVSSMDFTATTSNTNNYDLSMLFYSILVNPFHFVQKLVLFNVLMGDLVFLFLGL